MPQCFLVAPACCTTLAVSVGICFSRFRYPPPRTFVDSWRGYVVCCQRNLQDPMPLRDTWVLWEQADLHCQLQVMGHETCFCTASRLCRQMMAKATNLHTRETFMYDQFTPQPLWLELFGSPGSAYADSMKEIVPFKTAQDFVCRACSLRTCKVLQSGSAIVSCPPPPCPVTRMWFSDVQRMPGCHPPSPSAAAGILEHLEWGHWLSTLGNESVAWVSVV